MENSRIRDCALCYRAVAKSVKMLQRGRQKLFPHAETKILVCSSTSNHNTFWLDQRILFIVYNRFNCQKGYHILVHLYLTLAIVSFCNLTLVRLPSDVENVEMERKRNDDDGDDDNDVYRKAPKNRNWQGPRPFVYLPCLSFCASVLRV